MTFNNSSGGSAWEGPYPTFEQSRAARDGVTVESVREYEQSRAEQLRRSRERRRNFRIAAVVALVVIVAVVALMQYLWSTELFLPEI